MSLAIETAAQRLVHTREGMRVALRGISASPGTAAHSSTHWLESLKALAGAGLVIEALSQWWAGHPLRVTGQGIAGAAKAVIQPLAQRHPVALVLGAFVVGGLLAWSRPWRWPLGSGLLAGLLPQFLPQLLSRLLQPAPAAAQRPAAPWG